MDLDKLNELPIVFQYVTGAGLFVGGIGIAALGWLKKNFKLSEIIPGHIESKDAVVLNAAIADSQQLAKLALAINELVIWLKDREEDADRHNNKIVKALHDVRESNDEICQAVERQTKIFKERTIL